MGEGGQIEVQAQIPGGPLPLLAGGNFRPEFLVQGVGFFRQSLCFPEGPKASALLALGMLLILTVHSPFPERLNQSRQGMVDAGDTKPK